MNSKNNLNTVCGISVSSSTNAGIEGKNKIKQERLKIWIKGVNMCEVCGLFKATVNLDLKYGSHRECRRCWDN